MNMIAVAGVPVLTHTHMHMRETCSAARNAIRITEPAEKEEFFRLFIIAPYPPTHSVVQCGAAVISSGPLSWCINV